VQQPGRILDRGAVAVHLKATHCKVTVIWRHLGNHGMVLSEQMMPMDGFCWGCLVGWTIVASLLVLIAVAIVKLAKR